MEEQYLKFVKPRTANGGAKGSGILTSGQLNQVIPAANPSDFENGSVSISKFFVHYPHASNIPMTNGKAYFTAPTPADDRRLIGLGTQTDTISEIALINPMWCSSGKLNSDLSGGETTIDILMEGTEAEFVPGGSVVLSNSFKFAQTVDDGSVGGRKKVIPGDSVQYHVDGKWMFIESTDDIVYPVGIYLGGGIVQTYTAGVTNTAYITLSEKKTTGETIGTPTGGQTPPLTDLSNITNGLVTGTPYQPVITTSASEGTIQLIAYIRTDGTVYGDVTAGSIDVSTGQWISDITWTITPDADILIDYYDKNWAYSGNVATVECDIIADAFLASETYASMRLDIGTLQALYEDLIVNSSGGSVPAGNLSVNGSGAEYETITLNWVDNSGNFTVEGDFSGALGAGVSGTEFVGYNPLSSGEMFRITPLSGFLSGDTVTFKTIPPAAGLFIKTLNDAGANESDVSFNMLAVSGI